MPVPLIPYTHYNNFMEIALKMADKDQYDSEMLTLLQPYLVKLPKPHLVLLIYLLKFLLHMTQYSEKTKMDSNNFSIVFASNIIRPEEETMDSTLKYNHVNNLIKHMIDHVNELEDMIPTLKEKNESQDWLQDVIRHTKQTPFYVDDPSPRPPVVGEEESTAAPPYIPKPPETAPPPLVVPAKEAHLLHPKALNLKDHMPAESTATPIKRLLTANSQPAVHPKHGKEPRSPDTGDMALDSKVGKIDLASPSDGSKVPKSPGKRPVVYNKKGEKGDSTTAKTKV